MIVINSRLPNKITSQAISPISTQVKIKIMDNKFLTLTRPFRIKAKFQQTGIKASSRITTLTISKTNSTPKFHSQFHKKQK